MEQRLESLERRINRYRLLASCLGVAVLAAVGIAAATSTSPVEEIRAKKIVILNDQGKTVGLLEAGKLGGGLALFDSNGNLRLIAGGEDGGGRLILMDSSGKEGVLAIADAANGGKLNLLGKGGKPRTITAESAH